MQAMNSDHPFPLIGPPTTILEEGLGLFGEPEDAALLDEVVQLAYEERRRPARPSPALL